MGWGLGNFLENFGKFPGNSGKRLSPGTKTDILRGEIKNFTDDLKENTPKIMLNPWIHPFNI